MLKNLKNSVKIRRIETQIKNLRRVGNLRIRFRINQIRLLGYDLICYDDRRGDHL